MSKGLTIFQPPFPIRIFPIGRFRSPRPIDLALIIRMKYLRSIIFDKFQMILKFVINFNFVRSEQLVFFKNLS